MDQENPTAGDGGASIEERLERFLSAEDHQEEPATEVKTEGATAETTEQPETGAQEEVKQPQLTTAELAKIFGVDESTFDVDADGNVSVKHKIDGKEGAAKFADILRTYQLEGHAENRTRAAAERERALQAREQEAETAIRQRLDHLEQLANVAGAELMREYQSIDWASLRQADPGRYAAMQQDFASRKAQVQGVFQATNAQRQQQHQQLEAQRQAYLAAEVEKLPTLIPEWKDEATYTRESQAISEWAKKVGYAPERIKALAESSALDVATVRKAMLYDQLQESRAAVEKQVREAPKIVKPGQVQQDAKEVTRRGLKQSVVKSGGKHGSLEAYLLETGKV